MLDLDLFRKSKRLALKFEIESSDEDFCSFFDLTVLKVNSITVITLDKQRFTIQAIVEFRINDYFQFLTLEFKMIIKNRYIFVTFYMTRPNN